MLEQLQGTGKPGDRFGVSGTGCRLAPGAKQILYGLARVGAAAVMVGQLGQVIVDPILEQRLDRLTRALMQEPAALHQHGVVRDFLGQRVFEDVLGFGKGGLLVDELAELEIREQRRDLLLPAAPSTARSTSPSGDALPIIARVWSKSFCGRRQPVDAGGENSLDGVARSGWSCAPLLERDVAVAGEYTLLEQRLHSLLDKEGIALGLIDDQLLEGVQARIRAEQRTSISSAL